MRRRPRRWRPLRAWLGVAFGASFGFLLTSVASLLVWSILPGPGQGRAVTVSLDSASRDAVGALLQAIGVVRSPTLFAWYLRVFHAGAELELGEHVLNDALSPADVVARLARSAARPAVRVNLPEGFHLLQVAERLAELEICTREAFLRAARDRAVLEPLGISGESAEGYLFPATYDLQVDSAPAVVLRLLVNEMSKRFERLLAKHPGAGERLHAELGFERAQLLTLASMIEKEAARAEERPLIASVFYNRLRRPDFLPNRMLQSDPTAAYGCIIAPAEAPSCVEYHGHVTPGMLRDAANRYNTYRHPGLPPGPIANPGELAIEAALAPADTDFLFFVTAGAGRHTFTRTFEEHNRAVRASPSP